MSSPSIRAGHRVRAKAPHGSADSFTLTRLIETLGGPLLVLTDSAWQAQRLLDEMRWLAPQTSIALLPDWETLPYDSFSPHEDLISDRLSTLWQAATGQAAVLIVPVTTALLRLAPKSFLAARTFDLEKGKHLPMHGLRAQLALGGYTSVDQVMRPGEYCVKGGLMDIFPMGSALPYRIEWLDDDIDTLRTFDVDTQRTLYPVTTLKLLPAREFPLDEDGRKGFRQRFRESFEGDPTRAKLYKDIGQGITPGGIEYYLPLFFDETATLFDYLGPHTTAVTLGPLQTSIAEFWATTESRYAVLKGDRSQPVLPPKALFLSEAEFFSRLDPLGRLELISAEDTPTPSFLIPHWVPGIPLPNIEVERLQSAPLKKLDTFVKTFPGNVWVTAETLGRRESLIDLFRQHGLEPQLFEDWPSLLHAKPRFALTVGPLSAGFQTETLAIITETELFASQVRQSRRRDGRSRLQHDSIIRDLSEVRLNDPVVHIEHGVGRFMGLLSLDQGEGQMEFLKLAYADGDLLYVPVSELHQIGRYTGGPSESAPLHKLGSGQWERAKKRAARQIRDTAAELLDLYAKRAARAGFAFPFQEGDYAQFAAGFPFEETPDQKSAIEAVMVDMSLGRPMDRLICGDVGFGKTEVAMRAAFLAVNGGKQVAVLVPTTLLAEQHFQNFADRFAKWPVRIAELSRFRSAKEIHAAMAGIASGQVDIVIGTHKLLSNEIDFKALGLVIIDEEHRFGVRQKERLKSLRAEVDVLTLTATPIPRTLAMSMEGLRDFSVIATAPQRRLAIKTFVYPYADSIIREASLRELRRGGQIYFLHNEVDTILNQKERLATLLPEARIGVAHGQLPERELEEVMRDFYHQKFNLLLCSTIIETGIDVPSANTILIHRADKFGLAQLHQLRGRVGRSHHQAYAYLLTPPPDALTPAAKKRLEAIQLMEELGSGFFLAMHDLEIRGAGEVLGDSQSGEIQQVGFALYTEMLNNAVKTMKKGGIWNADEPLGVTTEINLHAPALLPVAYCADIQERLVIYKRLANCETEQELDDMKEELIDRFGLTPEPTQILLESHRLRLLARRLGVRKLDANGEIIRFHFDKKTPLSAEDLILLLSSHPNWRLDGQDRVKIILLGEAPLVRARQARDILEELLRTLPDWPQ